MDKHTTALGFKRRNNIEFNRKYVGPTADPTEEKSAAWSNGRLSPLRKGKEEMTGSDGRKRGETKGRKVGTTHFLPRDASAERGNATVSRPSVCPSVCLSVCDV